jgi:hypothetical protein
MKYVKTYESFVYSLNESAEVKNVDISKLTIENPKSGRIIKLTSALKHPENDPLRKHAEAILQKIRDNANKEEVKPEELKAKDLKFGEQAKHIDKEEYDILKDYQQGGNVGRIQRFARGLYQISGKKSEQKAINAKAETELKKMDAVIDKAGVVFKKGTVVWRGVDDASVYGDDLSNITDKGYTSTAKEMNDTVSMWSGDADKVEKGKKPKGMIMKIIFGEDIKALDMNGTLKKDDIDGVEQQEILLPRNLKFTLVKDQEAYKVYKVTR